VPLFPFFFIFSPRCGVRAVFQVQDPSECFFPAEEKTPGPLRRRPTSTPGTLWTLLRTLFASPEEVRSDDKVISETFGAPPLSPPSGAAGFGSFSHTRFAVRTACRHGGSGCYLAVSPWRQAGDLPSFFFPTSSVSQALEDGEAVACFLPFLFWRA